MFQDEELIEIFDRKRDRDGREYSLESRLIAQLVWDLRMVRKEQVSFDSYIRAKLMYVNAFLKQNENPATVALLMVEKRTIEELLHL